MKTDVQADEVEMLLVKEIHSKPDPTASPGVSVSACRTIDPCRDELHILEDHETLAELQAMNNFSQAPLVSSLSLSHESIKLIMQEHKHNQLFFNNLYCLGAVFSFSHTGRSCQVW